MNEPAPACARLPEGLSEPRREAFMEEFLALLTERTGRFTMGDSASIRLETAERLARGIQYCVELAVRSRPTGGAESVETLFETGVEEAKRLCRRGRLLLEQAQRNRPPVVNAAYLETLAALPAFFRAYDAAFFAQEIPCSVDYPLCHPVPETLLGAEYVCEYLRRLNMESTFLRRFGAPLLTILYDRAYGGDGGLLVNLYAPAAEAAIGRALAGKTVARLLTDGADWTVIEERIDSLPRDGALLALEEAARKAADELGVSGVQERAYLERTARDLLPRLRTLDPESGYRGIFASL